MRPAADKEGRYVLHLMTMDRDDNGAATVYSIAIGYVIPSKNHPEGYVGQVIGECGRDRVPACVAELLANLTAQTH